MKRLILSILVIVASAGLTIAQDGTEQITFAWAQVLSSDFAGWSLHVSETSGGPYTNIADIAYSGTPAGEYQANVSLDIYEGRTYYFVLDSFDTQGNRSQGYSNEVSWTAPDANPAVPQTLRIIIQ
jgi:hypothetical protein